jgi:hypothetical protein
MRVEFSEDRPTKKSGGAQISAAGAALSYLLWSVGRVHAHCPLCTAATVGALAITRVYGIDDLVVGTFFGGFIVSSAFWLNNVLRKRNGNREYVPYQSSVILSLSLGMAVVGFYLDGLLFNPLFMLFGVDKILIGTFAGTGATLASYRFHRWLRVRNENKSYLPFQAILLTLAALVATSLAFYALGLTWGLTPWALR